MKLLTYILCLLLTTLLPQSPLTFPKTLAQKTPLFTDISTSANIPTIKTPKYAGPSIADVNRDGIYDLLLSNHHKYHAQILFGKKTGGGYEYSKGVNLLTFGKADVHGISAGDIDLDGDLEVLVERGGGNGFNPSPPFLVGFNGKNGVVRGGGVERGLGKRGARGRGGKWIDVDGDGDLDLVLINEEIVVGKGIRQIVYENRGGKFFWKGMCGDLGNADGTLGVVADFDGDGKLDLILGHKLKFLKGSAGFSWKDVTQSVLVGKNLNLVQAIAEIDIDNDGDFDLYLARGWGADDVLLENRGGKFYDISAKAGLLKGGGHRNMVTVGDFNNDGFMDVFITRSTTGPYGESDSVPRLADYLLLNTGKKSFKVVKSHSAVTPQWDGHGDGCQAFDFDNDGRLDVMTSSEDGLWRLFKNITPRSPNAKYLLVRVLRAPGKTATSMGALVTVYVGKKLFRRRVGEAGASFQQSQLDIVHFGLGSTTFITKVVVRWSNGKTGVQTKVKPNTMIKFGV